MDRIYCPWCDDIRSFVKSTEKIKDKYKNEEIEFTFDVCRCEKCKKEVPGYPGYYQQRDLALTDEYVKQKEPPITYIETGFLSIEDLNYNEIPEDILKYVSSESSMTNTEFHRSIRGC